MASTSNLELLNSPETDYNWVEQFKVEHNETSCVALMGAHTVSVFSFLYLPFTPLIGNFCDTDGINKTLLTYTSSVGMMASGIYLTASIWKKCTLSWEKFSVLTSRESRVKILRSERFLADTGICTCGIMFLANAILVTTVNLAC